MLLLAAVVARPRFRHWLATLDLRFFVAVHLTGFVGLGLLDILFVVATAARLAGADPDSMSALLRLPLSLLVTFLVPIILADHVVVFWRIAARRRP